MSLQQTALEATNLVKKGIDPRQAWADAILKNYPYSLSMQRKGCPKNAFLGLCSEGMVKGIAPDNYTNSILNKRYSVAAIDQLKKNGRESYLPMSLWIDVLKSLNLDINKKHNGQMDVVLSLWDANLII